MLPVVLVINDLQATLNLYADLLESDKYELELSVFEFEKPRLIEMLNPSLVILDFQVDSHNRTRSWQLLDTIQLSPVVSSIPLIVCTPFMSDIREQEKHLKAHGIVIFYKPFNLDAFVQKVQELLGLSSSKLAVTSRKDVDSQAGRGRRSSPHLQGA